MTAVDPRFTVEYRMRILEEADRCRGDDDVGRLLRREGLDRSDLAKWRKERREAALAAMKSRKRGPKVHPLARDAKRLERELKRLEAEEKRLKKELATAHIIIEAQRELADLLGFSLEDGSYHDDPKAPDGSP